MRGQARLIGLGSLMAEIMNSAQTVSGDITAQLAAKAAKSKRFATLVAAFEQGIVDQIEASVGKGGVYIPSTDSLKAAAFPAMSELVESEFNDNGEVIPMGPMLAVVVWETVLKINESAFRKGLARKEKAGLLSFSVAKTSSETVGDLAAKYL